MKTKKVSRKSQSAGAAQATPARQRALTRAVEDAVSEAIRTGQPAGGGGGAGEVEPATVLNGTGGLRDVKNIRELARVVAEYDIAELELEMAGDRLRLRRGPLAPAPTYVATAAVAPLAPVHATPAAPLAAPPPTPSPAHELVAPAAPAVAPARSSEAYITSPFVGTFYRAPSPEASPFVEVGTLVKKGQPLCIVEAMKLMNEIEAEQDGRIVAVLAQNGQPVEYGEKLFSIEVLG